MRFTQTMHFFCDLVELQPAFGGLAVEDILPVVPGHQANVSNAL